MKKNIIIAVLAVTTILSTFYGLHQKTKAEEQESIAIQNEKMAREMSIKAEQAMKTAVEQRHMAEINAREAMQQLQIAQEALKKKK